MIGARHEDSVASAPGRLGTLPYPLVCTLLGLVLGWVPKLIHGPHPYKFTVWHLNGAIAVWAFYSARLLIGFHVGVTRWPARWWLRGALYGFLTMFPVTLVALANPLCGWT